MSCLLALFALALPLQDREAPDPKRVEEAVGALEEAFEEGSLADRLDALDRHGTVPDAAVVEWVERGLKDREPRVVAASLECLRWTEHPAALDVLHQTLARNKKLRKDEQQYAFLLRAIGQHGDPRSIEPLVDAPVGGADQRVAAARVFSLGNIRDVRSIDALMKILKKSGSAGRRGEGAGRLAREISVALTVLTGETPGDTNAWLAWWRENEKSFEVTEKPGEGVPKRILERWYAYWEVNEKGERVKREEGEEQEEGRRRRG